MTSVLKFEFISEFDNFIILQEPKPSYLNYIFCMKTSAHRGCLIDKFPVSSMKFPSMFVNYNDLSIKCYLCLE